MKITLFLLLLVIFQVYSGNCYSQNARVSIQNARLRVGQVLEQIESQTEYLFVYNKQNVDVRRTVDINASNQTVSEVLDQMFKGTDIKYVMEGKNIVLTKNSRSAEDKTDTLQEMATVRGKVTDSKGEPIIGANILEKGTANGVITNTEGEFSMNIPPYATIVVSYISYEPQTIALNGRNNLHIRMEEKSLALEQVVVTAMGIQKKMSSLTYSTQQISSSELTRAKEPNMINTLAGKTAGVQINKTANLGGSAKVVIRGARSAFASGNNQPLYVIDGVPMLNSSTESTSTVIGGNYDGLNRDAGDGISNLNPDDIESINILKGSSAAALYGSQAANGVILITTKKGKAGLQRVTFSSNLTVSHAISTPEFQNTYGRNEDGGTASWGTKGNVTDYDNIGEFFSNGITTFNSLAITTGNEKVQTYFSYANTTAKGIVDNNKLQKNNLNLHETASLFNNKLKLDGIATLMTQTVKNSPATGGYYLNPLVSLYSFPRGVDMSTYRENFETWNADRNMMTQNWIEKNGDGTVSEWGQNPYWLKNRVLSGYKRYRAVASARANLHITDYFNLQVRGNVDYISDKFDNKMYATTAPNIAGKYEDKENGLYPYAASGHQGVKGGAYSEEGARFVFDKEKLEAANSAYKYEYFNGTSVVEKTATVSPDGTILYIDGKKAAEIVNYAPNKLDANEITYNIKLEEVNPTHAPRSGDAPTEAAKALVGKYVPIKLVADVCYKDACAAGSLLAAAHTATIKEYDAFIIEPLTVTTGETENFTDATVGGSTIDVKGAFTYVSWNADESGKKYIVANTTGLQKALREFYEVVPGEWMTDQIKSNLKLVNGNLVPTDGVTNGPLPSNTKVVYNQADETLTYNNYSGTPVNWDYKLFIPVKFGYKWKTFTLTFEVDVKKNSGTPAQR